MKSPLQLYNETAKQFGIVGEKQLHIRQKLGYIESQIQESQSIINRLLVDIAIAKTHKDNSVDETLKAAHQDKVAKYEADLRQIASALDFNIQFKNELDKELKKSGEEA